MELEELEHKIEMQLYEDFAEAFREILGERLSENLKNLSATTNLPFLGINSLEYLESIEIVSQKYKIQVQIEEIGGSVFLGRSVFVMKKKIIEKYKENVQQIDNVLASEMAPVRLGNVPTVGFKLADMQNILEELKKIKSKDDK